MSTAAPARVGERRTARIPARRRPSFDKVPGRGSERITLRRRLTRLMNRTSGMLVLGLLVALGAAACSDSEPTSSGSASSAPTSSTTATSGVRREAGDVAVGGTFAGMVEGPIPMRRWLSGPTATRWPTSATVRRVSTSSTAGSRVTRRRSATTAARVWRRRSRRAASPGRSRGQGTSRCRSRRRPSTRRPACIAPKPPSPTGDYVGGWVLLSDGTQRGAVRGYETPLPPGAATAVLDPNNPNVVVPGGFLTARIIDSADI